MIIPIILLILLFLVAFIRISNNNDIIRKNNKTIVDTANIKNARSLFRKSKVSIISLIVIIILFIICILCEFTDIETAIIDAISSDVIDTIELDKLFYLLPFYILAIREILIQVQYGEFLLKYYNDKEEIVNINLKSINLKSLLYKKPSTKKKEETKPSDGIVRTNEINEILDVEVKK